MGKRIFLVVCLIVGFAAEIVALPAPAKSKGTEGKQPETVSYVGCLRSAGHGNQFVLTRVTGRDVPRSRSWKTVFFTTRPADVEVIGVRGMKLREYVGHTVRVTGRRTGHRVHAEAVNSMQNSCF